MNADSPFLPLCLRLSVSMYACLRVYVVSLFVFLFVYLFPLHIYTHTWTHVQLQVMPSYGQIVVPAVVTNTVRIIASLYPCLSIFLPVCAFMRMYVRNHLMSKANSAVSGEKTC